MEYEVTHRTLYEYSYPVTVSHHAARLKPLPRPGQELLGFVLQVLPEPGEVRTRNDFFGNEVAYFSLAHPHKRLEVIARSHVRVKLTEMPALALSPAWEQVVGIFSDPISPQVIDPYQFSFPSPLVRPTPEIAEFARPCFEPGRPLLEAVEALNAMIHREFKFDPKATTVATPLEEVFENRAGVCQDFAHVGIACLRSLGLPARYVSGYIRTHPPEGQERLRGADASHGWFSVYCPDLGWIDFDPTNNIIPSDEHIWVAEGRDYTDVAPVSGILHGGGEHEIKVEVDVLEVESSPLPG
jgi:transglutaminase-like putative cysteine protease